MSTSARVSSKRLIRSGHFWMSETKGRNREDTNRGRCLSIALHPNERMTVNRPWTCSPTAAVSSTAAISADNSNNHAAPFARASEADRKCLPGYSWPPHLYQDKLSLAELRTKSERNVEWTAIQTLAGAEAGSWSPGGRARGLMKRATNSGRREDPRSRGSSSHEMRERTNLRDRRKRRLLAEGAADRFSDRTSMG